MHSIPRDAGKRAMRLFLAMSAAWAAVIILFTFVADPFLVYHRPTWYQPTFYSQERYMNQGLVRQFEYDTIIIGTSMTQNFRPSQVNEATGGKVVKLSISGSTADEHYYTAKLALETGKVKRVIWGLDYFSLKFRAENPDFPAYLYDDAYWNDYRYWFNYTVFKHFARGIQRTFAGAKPQNIDLLNNWERQVTFDRERAIAAYRIAKRQEVGYGSNEEPLPLIKDNFNRYILSLVQRYPEVDFFFYYPPYSILRQNVWYELNPIRFANQLAMRKYMFERFSAYPNTAVFDFQTETAWTHDLSGYSDLSHHRGEWNEKIAEAIGRNDPRYRVEAGDIDVLNAKLEHEARTAVLDQFGNVVHAEMIIQDKSALFSDKLVVGDEVFVPVRELAVALGAELVWRQEEFRAELRLNGRTVIWNLRPSASGTERRQSADAPRFIDGRAMVPVRKSADMLGLRENLHRGNEGIIIIIS